MRRPALILATCVVAYGASAQEIDHSQHMPGMDHSQHAAPSDADRAAARAPASAHAFHDNDVHSFLLLDRLETWREAGSTGAAWEAKGWLGTDLTRLWLRSEGEHLGGTTGEADAELLYGRSISTWWDVVAGVRQDFAPGVDRTFAAIGVQGLAPQRFDVAVTAYFGEGNQGALRFKTERELLITNRLIAQPLLELMLYSQDDARRGIGSGFSTLEAGLRIRYEITRQFAPYAGVSHARAFGDTADLRRAAAQAVRETRFVAGVRLWF